MEQEKAHGLVVRNNEELLWCLRHQQTDNMKQGSDDTHQKQQHQHQYQEPVPKRIIQERKFECILRSNKNFKRKHNNLDAQVDKRIECLTPIQVLY